MAYVSKAKHDVFISHPMEHEQWAEHFEQDLKKQIVDWLGRELRVYFGKRDWQCAPSDAMLEDARNSAFFVAILSPGALQDDLRFFQREWEAFGQSQSEFGTVETRFSVALLKPIDPGRIEQFFHTKNKGSFWRRNEFYFEDRDNVPHTISRSSRKSDYNKKVADMAYRIKERLLRMKEEPALGYGEKAKGKTAGDGPFSGMRVLLGERDEQYAKEWNQIQRALLNDGVELLPDREYPKENSELEALLDRELPRADLLIQLLNPWAEASHRAELEASDPIDKVRSRAQVTYDSACAHLKTVSRPFGILQWRDPKIDRRIVKYWSEELLDGAHVQALGLQQFKLAVRTKLQELRKPQPPLPPSRPLLFIVADKPDRDLADELRKAALVDADVDMLYDEEQNRREQFVDAMALAAGVIFLHGKASVKFANNWLSMYVREKAKLKRRSYLDALYRAPPPKRAEEQPRIPSRDLRDLGSEELFTLEGIHLLCRELDGTG